MESLREERLRLEQASVASRGIRIGGLVSAPLRGGCPLERRRGSRTPHRAREDRARCLEEGAGTPPPRGWGGGGSSGSRATDWAARREWGRARVWCCHARERWAGREPVAPAPGCSLGRPARGVLRPLGNVMRSCAPIFFPLSDYRVGLYLPHGALHPLRPATALSAPARFARCEPSRHAQCPQRLLWPWRCAGC